MRISRSNCPRERIEVVGVKYTGPSFLSKSRKVGERGLEARQSTTRYIWTLLYGYQIRLVQRVEIMALI